MNMTTHINVAWPENSHTNTEDRLNFKKICLLICTARMAGGTSAIIHINRLKKAYEQMKGESALPLNNNLREKVHIKASNKVAPRGNDELDARKLFAELSSHPPVRDVECSESGDCDSDLDSSSHRRVGDPEWTAGASCLQKEVAKR